VAFSKRRFRVGNLVAIDSSIFPVYGYQPRRGRWVPKGTRPTQPKPIKSQKLHAYGGISKHGKTRLVFVTGTTGLPKRYLKPDGKHLYDGVCAQEFQDILKSKLLPQAKRIMRRAGEPDPVFLLDGAPPTQPAPPLTSCKPITSSTFMAGPQTPLTSTPLRTSGHT
jgi:hypothetical protein